MNISGDYFKRDIKAQLLPWLKVKRRLKRGAVPSLFPLGPEPKKTRINFTARENRWHEEDIGPNAIVFCDMYLQFSDY